VPSAAAGDLDPAQRKPIAERVLDDSRLTAEAIGGGLKRTRQVRRPINGSETMGFHEVPQSLGRSRPARPALEGGIDASCWGAPMRTRTLGNQRRR
jgi:hypothetical protein